MGRAWAIAVVAVGAAILAGSGGARTQVSSGDTCTFSANGSAYAVNIVTGNGVQQFGYAFGVPGLTITNIGVAGQNGTFTTGRLPANTTGAWVSDTQLTGTSSATLTVSGTAGGPVLVVPATASQSSYYDPVTCTAATTATKTVSFTVASGASYSKAAHGWHLVVTIPAAGTVSAKQLLATSISVKPKPLVQVKRQSLASRGKVTLLVKTTPQGQLVLNAKHVLKVRLTVTVDTKDGREAHKTIKVSLRAA
jgi:hypothetical protein